jgi:hypothetical protein
MMDEEREDTKGGEENSDEKNHPLSREGWIMLLSGELNKEERKLTSYWNACIVILIAFLCAEVAFLVAIFQSGVVIHYILVLTMFIFLALTVIYYKCYLYPSLQERLKPLIKARDGAIFSKSTDFSEIRRIWKEYVEKWLLEKSEMYNANKELEDGKGDLDKKDIKETLHRIETKMDEGKEFNFWCVFSGFSIAAGLAVIGMSLRAYSQDTTPFVAFSGLFMFAGGTLILNACHTNLSGKKLNIKNAWFF